MRPCVTAHRVCRARPDGVRPWSALVFLVLLTAVGCTSPRETLPPESGTGGAGGSKPPVATGGTDGGTNGGANGPDCDAGAEPCPGLGPSCVGAMCDGGGLEGPATNQPDTEAGLPAECPGGVKAFFDLPAEVSALDFSPDGAFVAAGARDGTVIVQRTSEGTELARNTKHRQAIQAVRFSHSGLALAAASEDGSLTLWNVGPTPPRVWVHGSFVYSVAFSADDVNMAVGGQRGVYVIRTATLASALRLESQLFNRSVAFLPGDAELLVAYGETAGQLVVLKASDLSVVRMIAQHLDPIPRAAVPARNATHLVYANGNFLRVNILATNASFPFDQHTKPIEDLRFASDGTRVATAAADATRVWVAGEWRVERSFGPSPAVALSPDGKRLARAEGRRVLIHCLVKE